MMLAPSTAPTGLLLVLASGAFVAPLPMDAFWLLALFWLLAATVTLVLERDVEPTEQIASPT